MPEILSLKSVSKQYALGATVVDALQDITLSVEAGDFVALAGPSGSGKSTMMNLIGCLDTPTAGTIYVADQKISSLNQHQLTRVRHRIVGFIFQSFNLLPVLNVYENVELPLLFGNPGAKTERREWIEYLLEEVGLADRAEHKPAELSGGQRQRVAIARALATRPQLVLADEPTANLDSNTGEMILELMRSINQQQNTTFLFATHDERIREMADHAIFLKDGRIDAELRAEAGVIR